MTHTIESVDHWPEGDTRIFPFAVTDEDTSNDRLDITGADIEWKLRDASKSEDVLSLNDTGVSLNITSATNGEFEVEVTKEATEDLEGDYREIIQITESSGERSSWTGRVKISAIQ